MTGFACIADKKTRIEYTGIKMRKILRTTDKELFTKINSLHFTDEVIVTPKPRSNSISTLLKSINKNKKIVERKNIGDRVILTRIAPFNFNILMNTKRRL